MRVYCGIDLGEQFHQVCLIDRHGVPLHEQRVSNDPAGLNDVTALLRGYTSRRSEVRIAAESSTALFVLALDAARYPIIPISPVAAARYRKAQRTAGSKSDRTDARDLADLVRVEFGRQQPLYHDSPALLALRSVARAQQAQSQLRVELRHRLRSTLASYYPSALTTFKDVSRRDARAALRLLSTPSLARSVRTHRLEQALREAGRTHGVRVRAQHISAGLREPSLRQPLEVEQAKGLQARLLLDQIDAAVAAEQDLLTEVLQGYATHPLHEIVTSFPGLSGMLGARLLAEIGDDHRRFTNLQNLRARAGTCPVTRTTGTSMLVVVRRRAYNHQLSNALIQWAHSLCGGSPAAQADYQRRRDHGDRYNAAVRHLMNRYIGILAHCLRTNEPYDESKVAIQPGPDAPGT